MLAYKYVTRDTVFCPLHWMHSVTSAIQNAAAPFRKPAIYINKTTPTSVLTIITDKVSSPSGSDPWY